MELSGTGTKHIGSYSARLGLDISKQRVVTLLHTTVSNYKVGRGTSEVRLGGGLGGGRGFRNIQPA